jgi:hypothetical protein
MASQTKPRETATSKRTSYAFPKKRSKTYCRPWKNTPKFKKDDYFNPRRRKLTLDELDKHFADHPGMRVLWLTEICRKNKRLKAAVSELVDSILSTCRCNK